MSEKRRTIVSQDRNMKCDTCQNFSGFEVSMYVSDVPFTMKCPNCNAVVLVDENSFVKFNPPKRDPRVSVTSKWLVYKTRPIEYDPIGEDEEEVARKREQIERELDENEELLAAASSDEKEIREAIEKVSQGNDGEITLKDRVEGINGMAMQLIMEMAKLEKQMKTTIESMIADQQVSIGIAESFGENFDLVTFRKFVQCPFACFPFRSEDTEFSLYTKVILVPAFYTAEIGIPVGSYLGFDVQLICPYQWIEKKLQPWVQSLTEIPPVVELSVIGRKIVGKSLGLLWRNIPSVSFGIEHTEADPSIYINGPEARMWLARLGCKAWSKVISSSTEDMPFIRWVYANHPEYKQMLDSYRNNGRIFVTTASYIESIYIARMISCMHQPQTGKPIYIYSEAESFGDEGRSRRALSKYKFSSKFYVNTPVRVSAEDYLSNPDKVTSKAGLLIVNANHGKSLDVIKTLYGYNGRVLITSIDPLFDIFGTNEYASTVYGLVNGISYRHHIENIGLGGRGTVKSSWGTYNLLARGFQEVANDLLHNGIKKRRNGRFT